MYLKLAWRNIWRNKRRTLITLAAISFAVFLASLMQSSQVGTYERMVENAVRFHTGYIQVHKAGYWQEQTLDNGFALSDKLLQSLGHDPRVRPVVPRLESFALVSHKNKTRGGVVIGTLPQAEHALTKLRDRLVSGRYLRAQEPAVLVGQGLAAYLGLGVGDTLVLVGQGYHGANAVGAYPVVGILRFPAPDLNGQLVYMGLPEAQYFYGAPGMATAVALGLPQVDALPRALAAVRTQADPARFEVMDWREMMPGLVQSMELDYTSGAVLMNILYAVIGFSMFGTLLMMTSERRYEFGVMLAVGMRKARLQAVVYLEIALLGLVGVAAGCLLSLPVISYLHAHPVPLAAEAAEAYERFGVEPLLPFALNPAIFLHQAGAILLLTVVLGLYPLWVIGHLRVATVIKR